MTARATILVTGATGCVGRAVINAAQRDGWRVRGMARHAPAGAWPSEVELMLADVRDRPAVQRATTGCAGVVHLAGWVHRTPSSDEERTELRSSIVDGTESVATCAAAIGARFVMTSSIAVYGRSRADDTPQPHTPYGQAKLEAERRALALVPDAVVLRPAVVYGPHDRGNVAALIHAVERRYGFIVGDGTNRKSIVHAANLADRILAALMRRDLAGAWVAADDPAPTQRELLAVIARALGRRQPRAVPRWPLSTAATLIDLFARTHYRDRVLKLSESTEYPGQPLDRALGYTPRVRWPDGLRATIGQV